MAEKLIVSGARGASVTEMARATGSFGAASTDSDVAVMNKFADYAIEQNPGFQSTIPGPADNTYFTLATFKASDITRKTASLVGVSGVTDGRFNWTLGNFTGQADDANIVKSDSTALSVGAWVRQGATGINFDGRSVDAKLAESVSITDARFAGGASRAKPDNSPAIQAAMDYQAGQGGGTVEVPLGTFAYATGLIQRAGVRIVGQGFGSRLHYTGTARVNGISASGASNGSRISGLGIANIRLTSTFDNNGITTGNAIRWLWVSRSFISNVWTHGWSDSGISLTDCDYVHGSTIDILTCSQGYDVFNDSSFCTGNGLTMNDISTYVGLNIEGLAAGSTKRPRDCVFTNVVVNDATTHGINLVNAIRPVISNWSVTGSVGSAEGPGDGLQAYGCTNANIGPGTAFGNAGRGLDIGPTMDDTQINGVVTAGNALGGCRVTDGGAIGTSLRVGMSGCKFMEGPPQVVGNASFLNSYDELTLRGALPAFNLMSTSTTKRNAALLFRSGVDADIFRAGVDISTNNGTKVYQIYLDSAASPIFSVTTTALTGFGDNVQSLGAPSQRFTTVHAGTGSIQTSDETTKQQIGDIPDEWLDAWADVDWLRFKFNDAVAEKGDAARWHIGVIAQRVRDAFLARGLDATDIGLLCYDEWEAVEGRPAVLGPEGDVQVPAVAAKPAGSLWSVRLNECLALEAEWQRREIARLAAKVAALEGAG